MREVFEFLFNISTDFQYGVCVGIFAVILFASFLATCITIYFKICDFVDEYENLKKDVEKLNKKIKKIAK